MRLPDLSSIFVFESTEVLLFAVRGGLRGTMVGTATDPAVILLGRDLKGSHRSLKDK